MSQKNVWLFIRNNIKYEYEKIKIQESTQIAQRNIDGKEKTIPLKIAMKQLDKQINKIENW